MFLFVWDNTSELWVSGGWESAQNVLLAMNHILHQQRILIAYSKSRISNRYSELARSHDVILYPCSHSQLGCTLMLRGVVQPD